MSAQQRVQDSLSSLRDNVVTPDSKLRGTEDYSVIFLQVIQFLTLLAGSVALAALVWAGFQYMVAAGNENQIANAKRVAFWAVVGLIVIAGAFIVLQFIQSIFAPNTISS